MEQVQTHSAANGCGSDLKCMHMQWLQRPTFIATLPDPDKGMYYAQHARQAQSRTIKG